MHPPLRGLIGVTEIPAMDRLLTCLGIRCKVYPRLFEAYLSGVIGMQVLVSRICTN